MALVEQIVAIGGVLAGAMGSYLVTRMTEQARQKHERQARSEQRRFDAYVKYVTTDKRVIEAVTVLRRVRLAEDPDADLVHCRQVLDLAIQDRGAAFEEVVLLGDEATIEAGHELNACTWRMVTVARDASYSYLRHEYDNVEMTNGWVAALNTFHEQARKSLGVHGPIKRRDEMLSLMTPSEATGAADRDG
ncbi:hypothetical protein OG320_14405 [Microbispora sp. NBC_01189]|uniref:hypothetical protein n=1 Tax=Microbispora sp. NBC_01189 TaxID=2903583 RepID=UPI002E110CFD|nr:hypothetical protein OG320_14405 [Microbispora sp. NBC_01189]